MKRTNQNPDANAASQIADRVQALIGVSVCDVPYERILRAVSELDSSSRHELLECCSNVLEDRDKGKVEFMRVLAVRILVGLLPDSVGVVLRWIQERPDQYSSEVRFTLFCYLDWVNEIRQASQATRAILVALENYLLRASSGTARAPWMAGDMLGAHWDTEQALPILLRAVSEGMYASGRLAAAHGLRMLLERPELSSSARTNIKTTLNAIARHDRSRFVRLAAQMP